MSNEHSFSALKRIKKNMALIIITHKYIFYLALAQLLSAHVLRAEGLGFKSWVGQIGTVSPTARHRSDVVSELCSPDVKPRRLPRYLEMGIYRDNLSATIFYRLSLSLKIVLIYRLYRYRFCNIFCYRR